MYRYIPVSADGQYIIAGTEAAPPPPFGGGGGTNTNGPGQGGGMPAGVVILSVPDLRVRHVWELSGNAGVSSLALTVGALYSC